MKPLIFWTIFFLVIIVLCIIYWRKLTIKGTILFVGILSYMIGLAIHSTLEREIVKIKVTSNSVFSIGTVIKYSPKNQSTRGHVRTGWVSMSVPINGRRIETRSSILLPTNYTWGEPEGKDFLVVYDSLDTQTCVLLFDYPIKDSSDYVRYLEEFKQNPLDIGQWKDTCAVNLLKRLY